jgi:hypothetical protein
LQGYVSPWYFGCGAALYCWAKVLATGYLLVDLLSLWCHIVAEATGRFHGLVAEAAGVVEWTFAAVVEVAMGGGWVACMLDRMEALASVPIGKGYQLPIKALLILLFLYQCTAFLLWLVGPLPAF